MRFQIAFVFALITAIYAIPVPDVEVEGLVAREAEAEAAPCTKGTPMCF